MLRKNYQQSSNQNKSHNYDYDYGMLQFQQNKSLRQEKKVMQTKLIKAREMEHKMDMILCHNQEIVQLNQSLKQKITSLYSENKKLKTQLNQALYDLSIYKNQDKKNFEISQKINEELSLNRIKKWQLEGFNSCHKNQIFHLRKRLIQEQSNNLEKTQKFVRQIQTLNQFTKALQSKILTQEKAFKQLQQILYKVQIEKVEIQNDFNYDRLQHKRQLDNLKAKMEVQFIFQLDNVKKRQKCQIQTLEGQKQNFKNIINDLQLQLNQLKISNQKVKINYQQSIQILKGNLKESEILISKLGNDHKFQLDIVNENIKGKIETQVLIAKKMQKSSIQQQQAQIISLYQLLKQKNEIIIESNQNHSKVRTQLQNQVIKNKEQLQFCLKQLSQLTERFNSIHKGDIQKLTKQINYYKSLLSKRQDQFKIMMLQKQNVENKITVLVEEVNHISEQKMKTLDLIQKQMRQLKLANISDRSLQGSQRQKLSKKLLKALQLKQRKINQLQESLKKQKEINHQSQKLIQTLKLSVQAYQNQIKQKQTLIVQLGEREKNLTKRIQNIQSNIKRVDESPIKTKGHNQNYIDIKNTVSKTVYRNQLSGKSQNQNRIFRYDMDKTMERIKKQHQALEKEVKHVLKQEASRRQKQFDSYSKGTAHFRQSPNIKKFERKQ